MCICVFLSSGNTERLPAFIRVPADNKAHPRLHDLAHDLSLCHTGSILNQEHDRDEELLDAVHARDMF